MTGWLYFIFWGIVAALVMLAFAQFVNGIVASLELALAVMGG